MVAALLTAGACFVLGHAATWVCRMLGVSSSTTTWIALWLLLTVVLGTFVAVLAGPDRARRPMTIVAAAVTGAVLLIGLSWPS